MRLIVFRHPPFFKSRSINTFTDFIITGMKDRGHQVAEWTATPLFYQLPVPEKIKKWLGYIDQYLVFPLMGSIKVLFQDKDTLYIFPDQALCAWMLIIGAHPHVVHVHDFIALRAAKFEFNAYKASLTGRLYQKIIQRGFNRAERFICVSKKTRFDLLRFLSSTPKETHIVNPAVKYPFNAMDNLKAWKLLTGYFGPDFPKIFILHVGSNDWYKNREGVLQIYSCIQNISDPPLPLVMAGPPPTENLLSLRNKLTDPDNVRFVADIPDVILCSLYSSAELLIFPSIAEGFGLPILEAMTSGCMVITTDNEPMNEIAGDAARYIPNVIDYENSREWATICANKLVECLNLSTEQKESMLIKGFERAAVFNRERELDEYEAFYSRALEFE